MPLGKEVGLGPGHIVLDGDPAPTAAPPHFRRMPTVAKRLPISATAEHLFTVCIALVLTLFSSFNCLIDVWKMLLLLLLLLLSGFTSHLSSSTSSAEWSQCRPPFSLVCGQLMMMWNIVCHFVTWTLVRCCKAPLFATGCAVSLVSLETVHWHHGRLNPGYQIVESSTREELTTKANFQ